MKPGNVLISSSGEVKVVDFGIAKGVEEGTSVTRTGALMGTAAYLAPEQIEGHAATAQSDLYALGCLMFSALCGAPPYEGDTAVAVAMKHLRDPVPSVRARRPDVPTSLEQVIASALEKDPSRRYASATQMDAALRAISPRSLPDTAPTVVMPAAAEATMPKPHTEVLLPARTQAKPRPPRASRVLGTLAALMLAAAAVWLVAAYLANRGPSSLDAPLPSQTATPAPATAAPTPTQAPAPSPVSTPASPSTPQPVELPGLKLGPPEEPAPTDEPTDAPSASPADATPQATAP
jgi:serine/threonine-protein kinase